MKDREASVEYNNKKRKEYSDKTLPHWQFLFLDSHIGWPGFEPVPSRWEDVTPQIRGVSLFIIFKNRASYI
jgi:hypothetical protein